VTDRRNSPRWGQLKLIKQKTRNFERLCCDRLQSGRSVDGIANCNNYINLYVDSSKPRLGEFCRLSRAHPLLRVPVGPKKQDGIGGGPKEACD
jgi:hypothetical protein